MGTTRSQNPSGIPSTLLGGTDQQTMYPEIFFKLEPDISTACDDMAQQLSVRGYRGPTEEMVVTYSDRVYESASRKYPDLVQQAIEYEKRFPNATVDFGVFGMQIRRRGAFRDLIAFLLLLELFRRRRRRRRF